jgi:hypothetical protein
MTSEHSSSGHHPKRLTLAAPAELPKTFAELADESNRRASLRKKLGERSYWLLVDEFVGVYRPVGLTVGELRFMDNRIPLAVRYKGTRRFTKITYDDVMSGETEPVDASDDEYVVFDLLSRPGLQFEDDVERYGEFTDATDEVAIGMGQVATLLDWHEHDDEQLYVPSAREKAYLYIVPDDSAKIIPITDLHS